MREVEAPDGRRWRVGRRWTRRRVRWRRVREREEGEGRWWDALEFLDVFDLMGEHPVLGLVALVVVVLVLVGFSAVFLVPLLLALVDVLVLVALLLAGALTRVLLRRPWEVEASTDGPPPETRSWPVRGWGESGRAVDQVARRLELGVANPSPDLAERRP